MELTQDQGFKYGFLYRCAEEGLSAEEIHQRVKQAIHEIKTKPMTKEAIPWIGPAIGGALGGGAWLGGKLLGLTPTMAALGVGLPVAAGVGGGYLAAKMTGSGNKDVIEDAKRDEIIGEYERLAEEAKRRAKLKRLQNLTGRRIIPLTPSLGL